mmetsp:Transcript_4294/g.6288  ORF Transcript_4294/g.6288 Transcript_4294/m.6288 type:complete len:433 (-) Transcript_4294:139-1437(-)
MMLCNYTKATWSVLTGMIITGSVRSVAVKLVYQRGFEAPLTITMLYLLGQALSLVVYTIDAQRRRRSDSQGMTSSESTSSQIDEDEDEDEEECRSLPPKNERRGSLHGLTMESEERITWIHSIPWYAKPVIPAFFNLLNSTLRWFSLIYVVASVAEMLISGTELALSVIAAKIFRRRRVSLTRWAGVSLVIIGIVVIGLVQHKSAGESSSYQQDDDTVMSIQGRTTLGIILIVLQSVLSVLQDITEEIFMQAADFPPTLMLGMEGCYGLCLGLLLYFTMGGELGAEKSLTAKMMTDDHDIILYMVGLTILFLITGIFNIKATEVTSAMTRNVWKNFRTILVWVVSLLLYYLGNNKQYGEPWLMPESFYTLLGFIVMFVGITVYYWFKTKETAEQREMNQVKDSSGMVEKNTYRPAFPIPSSVQLIYHASPHG